MMQNKYGYFQYSDVSFDAKQKATYTINAPLQEGSALTQLSVGVEPYNYASFEKNAYITSEPKLLYKSGNLGLLTSVISDENGYFETPIEITAEFPMFFSTSGITLSSRNIIKNIEIVVFRNNEEISRKSFSAEKKDNFYDVLIDTANKVKFIIYQIEGPEHFLGIYNIEYGSIKPFEDNLLINAEINEFFSPLSDTLEYDTLNVSIFDEDEKSFLFRKRQNINFIDNEKNINKFYIESGTETNDGTINILAYDWVSKLEDEFLGGMYIDVPVISVIEDITHGIDVELTADNEILRNTFSGYIPITTKRKALRMILQGCNLRVYKNNNAYGYPRISTFKKEPQTIKLNNQNILKEPQKNNKTKIGSVVIKQHNYSKGTEFKEAYHWYISTTSIVTIRFSEPLHSLEAYEVTGIDENGNDIISVTQSENVVFYDVNANYCTLKNSSQNKIVIKGLNYVESVVEYKKTNPIIEKDLEYNNIIIDLNVWDNPQEVCDLIYELYERSVSITFKTFEKLKIGECYNILGENLNIAHIRNDLNGIYEVEAI